MCSADEAADVGAWDRLAIRGGQLDHRPADVAMRSAASRMSRAAARRTVRDQAFRRSNRAEKSRLALSRRAELNISPAGSLQSRRDVVNGNRRSVLTRDERGPL